MDACNHLCMCIYIYIWKCICVCMCRCTYRHTYLHVYTYVATYAHKCNFMYGSGAAFGAESATESRNLCTDSWRNLVEDCSTPYRGSRQRSLAESPRQRSVARWDGDPDERGLRPLPHVYVYWSHVTEDL